MIVTCPECHVNYRLDPGRLGAAGRKVLCTECRHTWHQPQVEERAIEIVMANSARETEPVIETAPPPSSEDSFEDILKQTSALLEQQQSLPENHLPETHLPEALMPAPLARIEIAPAVPRTPSALATAMGSAALSFLFFAFLSATVLFLAKQEVARVWPPAEKLYAALGIHVPLPGEGLRLGALEAENRVDKSGRALIVTAKLDNMTETAQPYPPLKITLSDATGADLKSWNLDNAGAKPLAPGESAPVKLEFRDAPEGGADVEIRVMPR